MNRRVVGAGAVVAAFVVVAGIASQGRPLSTHRGQGPTATFFDYLATTLVLFAVFMAIVAVVSFFSMRTTRGASPRSPWHVFSSLLAMATGIAVAFLIVHSGFDQRLREILGRQRDAKPPPQRVSKEKPDPTTIRNAHIRWDEVAIVLALVAGMVVLVVASRGARRAPRLWKLRREEVVSQALDESLDDLRNDPDVRRAIIAAYARMERVLASDGLARHPAEAPFEYVERALTSLDASAEAAERLTALFEWAKFSQHEPGPEMRDEAIAALVAVRDELQAPQAVTA
jgi:amino acid transporter